MQFYIRLAPRCANHCSNFPKKGAKNDVKKKKYKK